MNTLWLEFAKASLTGILANSALGVNNSESDIASMVCEQADEMMKAIEERKESV